MSFVKRQLDLRRGRREVARRLKGFGEKAPEAVVTQMETSAVEITGTMKRIVSDDRELQDSIGFGPDNPAGPSGVLIGRGRGIASRSSFGRDILYLWAGSYKAFWARWREFGTAAHSLAKGASRARGKKQDVGPHHPGEKAQPFFWPTWRGYVKKVKKDMRKAYKSAAQAIFGNVK